ncbi:efflux RND transporter periplasmic adaptor subunit [Cellvibrio sp. QJXJ]|uniref:efflux RND transporter periplasmic adaptor subunit n=1 Tax=Cellvibrio sp. QJXJ TaxID=2964606 RepID=UPI0021C35764|nr:HlyD family efflux transporter periplasmic adaptor subunit [Cellvibrio sp. QJXJ]UUA71657.1 efflux RND transporter periplasmic adaptor subunit [Cellvibrio sp. QJXJ]
MNPMIKSRACALALVVVTACGLSACSDSGSNANAGHGDGHTAEAPAVEKGEHNGRLLHDKNFTLELAIFETGVPPEYRAWALVDGKPIAPAEFSLQVRLTRLGNKIDTINFAPQGDALRGDSVIYEPHSFIVTVEATHKGNQHRWEYESFEGRTRIEPAVAEALEIATEIAGPALLKETIAAYGKVVPHPNLERDVQARFDGVVTDVQVTLGQSVEAGQALFTVESNESLKSYTVKAPIKGVLTALHAKAGQQTGGKTLARILDNSRISVELAVFPEHLHKVKNGAPVTLTFADSEFETRIEQVALETNANQSVNARVTLDQPLPLGAMVKAQIQIDEYEVPLAVKRSGLQAFRDFTVVYAQIGDEYEVRMLELGREAGDWVEVLGGLEPGTTYVTENSFVIKADIEKSGASHDH